MRDHAFVARLERAFDHVSMADVARRLDLPHATVRNYFKEGRLPSPEVLIKIARETGVSLNWLLLGTGEVYAGETGAVGLGKFIEEKIGEIIDRKLDERRLSTEPSTFDLDGAIRRHNDPNIVLDEWVAFEGRKAPADLGLAFFRGWESFTPAQKARAVRDAKKALDRVTKE